MAAEPLTASVFVQAEPADVYSYFTEATNMVRWMGEYALLDARPGGEFTVDIEGFPVRGRFQELERPTRVVFTWGFAGSDDLPPGGSTVEVLLSEESGGTRVQILHHGLPPTRATRHAEGWRKYLDRLALAATGSMLGPA